MGVHSEEDDRSKSTASVDVKLWKACRKGNVGLCSILLKRHGDITCSDSDGNTCLHVATIEGHIDVVDAICQHLGCVSCVSKSISRTVSKHDLKFRKEQLHPLMIRNSRGETPLFIACKMGHEEIACYLCRRMTAKGINGLDNFGRSPMWIAARYGKPSIITALFAAGGDLDLANPNGETPLWAAAYHGHVGAVRCLCDLQCESNEVSKDGLTPLSAALEAGHLEVVDVLSTYGATAWKNSTLLSSSPSAGLLCAHTMPCPPEHDMDGV